MSDQIKILVNDGIHELGRFALENAGFEVNMNKIDQDALVNSLADYDAVIVRSATKITKEIIDSAPKLKLIARGGVGLDNIDVAYAESKGIEVINTPTASSNSVAELVFAHLFGLARNLHDANRQMPAHGASKFKELKKKYSRGIELKGKTLGVIGLGRIGQETARIALGIGMNVVASDIVTGDAEVEIKLPNDSSASYKISKIPMKDLFAQSDFITIHAPFKKGDSPVLAKKEFEMMKDGVGIINCARGGVIDEEELLAALESGKVSFAGVDVYMEEPTNNQKLLSHSNVSLTPHIGASTIEAQERIGLELAEKITAFFIK